MSETVGKPEHVAPTEITLANPLASPATESDTGSDATTGQAVYLEQGYEKPVTHLAIMVGLGHVIMNRRRQEGEHAGYEQLPPRKH